MNVHHITIVLHKLAIVLRTIRPSLDALTVLQIFFPLTRVLATVFLSQNTFIFPLVSDHTTFIYASVSIGYLSFSFSLSFDKLSFVPRFEYDPIGFLIDVLFNECALSVIFVLGKVSDIIISS